MNNYEKSHKYIQLILLFVSSILALFVILALVLHFIIDNNLKQDIHFNQFSKEFATKEEKINFLNKYAGRAPFEYMDVEYHLVGHFLSGAPSDWDFCLIFKLDSSTFDSLYMNCQPIDTLNELSYLNDILPNNTPWEIKGSIEQCHSKGFYNESYFIRSSLIYVNISGGH